MRTQKKKWKQGWGEGGEMDCKRTDEEEEMERDFTKGGGQGNEKASKKGSVIRWQATCITV